MAADWQFDSALGQDWSVRMIGLGQDSEGPVDAALVRRSAGPRRSRAILYLHGFVDYFFQAHEATYFESLGYDFYALDLRKFGRALHPGQSPNYVTELAVYREEIDAAMAIIRSEENHETVVVLGHSTGGLIASLWANARYVGAVEPDSDVRVDGLILNSPWFGLNKPWYLRTVGTWLLDAVGRVAPRLPVGGLTRFYGEALHKDTGGEWDYNLAWKPHEGFPVRAGWFRSIRAGHRQVLAGLHIGCPVVVLTSARSGDAEHAHPELLTTDSVLDVEQIRKGARRLGPDVTLIEIEGGAHDLALSPQPARQEYFEAAGAWLTSKFGPVTD